MAPVWAKLFPNFTRFQIQLLSRPLTFFITQFAFWYLLYFIPGLKLWAVLIFLPIIVLHIKNKTYHSIKCTDLKNELALLLLFLSLYVFSCSFSLPIWGEKPMDMGFLQTFLRTPKAIISDPWLSGHPLHYYYQGAFSYGLMGKLLSTSDKHIYLLSHSFNFFLFVCSVLVAVWHWVQKPFDRALTFFGVIFTINLIPLFNIFSNDGALTKFWNVSRVFSSNHFFAEYPIWSYLLADFHPHYIAYPIVFVFIFTLMSTKKITLTLSIFLGVLLVLLMGINTWDFIFCSAYLFLFDLKNREKNFAIAQVSALILTLPWLLILSSGKITKIGFQSESLLILLGMLKHQVLIIPFLIYGVARAYFLKQVVKRRELVFYIIAFCGVSFIYLIDSTNTVFKFTGGLTIFAIVMLIFYAKHIRFLFFPSIISFLLLLISLRGYFHLPQNDYLPQYSKKTKQKAQKLRKLCKNKNCTLLEWPGNTYDYTRMHLSSLTGIPSYIGQSQHLLVRNGEEIRPIISSRRTLINLLFSQEEAVDNRKVYLCKGRIEEDSSFKNLIKQCDLNVSF